jgi:hypothetical protein
MRSPITAGANLAAACNAVPGTALRIAAGHYNFGRGFPAVRAADKCTRSAIGLRRHAAGIQDQHIGSQRHNPAHRAQISRHGLAVGARQPATEMLNVKSRHRPSLMNCSNSRIRANRPKQG